MKEKALVYLGKHAHRMEDILPLFTKYEITPVFLDDEDMEQTILTLFEKEGNAKTCSRFPFDFILFQNNERNLISAFYHDSKDIFPFTHKAILTAHNGTWKLCDLLIEMEEEHRFFQKWEHLHALLKEANSLPFEEYEEVSYTPYKNAFLKGYILTKQGKPTMESLTQAIAEIENTRKQLKRK